MAKEFKTKRIQYDDDMVVVYDKDGKEVYKGLEDYDPYKDENWRWNDALGGYQCNGMTKYCLDI